MSLLKPSEKDAKEQIRIYLKTSLIKKMEKYAKWADLHNIDEFIDKAAEFVFKKDTDWKKFDKQN
ncbi:MAG: hypothetical protein LEGION0398_MBIBDBAK_00545 [Legionellaceae bacterium]